MSEQLASLTIQAVRLKATDFSKYLQNLRADSDYASRLSPFLDALEIACRTLSSAFEEEIRQARAMNASSDELVTKTSSYLAAFTDIHRYLGYVRGTRRFEYPRELITPSERLLRNCVDDFALVFRGQSDYMYQVIILEDFPYAYLAPWKQYIQKSKAPKLPKRFIFLPFPMAETHNILIHTVILGHEIAHVEDIIRGHSRSLLEQLQSKIARTSIESLAVELAKERNLGGNSKILVPEVLKKCMEIASEWLGELMADLIAVRRFSLAYLFSALEVLATFGCELDRFSRWHPSWRLRLHLLTKEVSDMGYFLSIRKGRPMELAREARMLSANKPLEPSDRFQKVVFRAIYRIREEIARKAREITENDSYDFGEYKVEHDALVALVNDGSPPSEIVDFAKRKRRQASLPGILNAGWGYRVAALKGLAELMGLESDKHDTQSLQKLNALVSKAIEAAEMRRFWPVTKQTSGQSEPPRLPDGTVSGILSGDEIMRRLYDPEPSRRISVCPLIDEEIKGTTIDLRLGTKFITAQKSEIDKVDPLKISSNDIRRIQSKVEVEFGKTYFLHPGQLILASTFEYVSIPEDVCAFVTTRSSYGRLGLLTATAIYIHPGYKGCLTLEMVNYGDQPISLYPGLRIAQLIVCHAGRASAGALKSKYALATEPEFPKIHDDDDVKVLRKIAKYFEK